MIKKEEVLNFLKEMSKEKYSDLFITVGMPVSVKHGGEIKNISSVVLEAKDTEEYIYSLMSDKQIKDFEETLEANFAVAIEGYARFRVNAFKQQGKCGAVIRLINTKIPDIESLGVPEKLKDIILEKRGLIIVVGATGSGKSTTLAAMLGYRNKSSYGHIITIEDPIEFVHEHQKSIVTQREIGVDTKDWHNALKNTLRQAPDVILIGEIRDQETMEYAINFAETGHLCLATLHANNANQALDRIINFFPPEKRHQLLMDLSLNLKSIISQRLVVTKTSTRVAAVEILLNTPYIQDLIFKGNVSEIKEAMKKGKEFGMQTFDQALFDYYEKGLISYQETLRNADSITDLKLNIKLNSKNTEHLESENKERQQLKIV